MPGISFNERYAEAAKIIAGRVSPAEIEFGDDTAGEDKKTAVKNIYKQSESSDDSGGLGSSENIIEYDFEDGGVLSRCRVEDYNKGYALFADFLRDAKKYYKKTCIHAEFIYFFSYRPMYRDLNQEQLCWYLFWRSKIRGGDYIKTGLSYIFLYIFEQINLSDLIAAEKVYENIIKIWKNYRKEFPRLDKYIAEWLTDFALINKIKINLDDISEILPDIINIAPVPEIFMKDDFFKNRANTDLILKYMCVYDYRKSKFYSDKDGKNKDLFDYHAVGAVHAVLSSGAFEEILKSEIADGVKIKATRESFMGAVCTYNSKKKITVEYKNLWKNFRIREIITNSMRYAENIIRDYLQIKSKLNISGQNFPAELADIILEYKNKYLVFTRAKKVSVKIKGGKNRADGEIEHEHEITEFAPNLQTAAEIEKSSWETTQTLLELQNQSGGINILNNNLTSFADENIDDNDNDDNFEAINTGEPDNIYEHLAGIAPETNTEIIRTQENVQEDIFDILENLEDYSEQAADLSDMAKLIADLNDDELSAVEMFISGRNFNEISAELMRGHGIMLEALIESINEKAVNFTGDIIFENERIIDDYSEEIKSCLKI